MNSKHKLPELLERLLNEKGNRCISVIVPLATLQPLREENKVLLEKAFANAIQLCEYKYPTDDAAPLLSKLRELADRIDPIHIPKGIGFYISSVIQEMRPLAFTPKESIVVGYSFQIRDLLQSLQVEQEYLLLTATENVATLYKGECNHLEILKLDNMPTRLTVQYEYAAPSRSTSYSGHSHVKSFERDQQLQEDNRIEKWLEEISLAISHYANNELPLAIMASKRISSLYRLPLQRNSGLPIKISKDPAHLSVSELADIAWPAVHHSFEEEVAQLIREFRELVGKGRGRAGLQECWRAAQEGNCQILLVEKNYRKPGFLTNDPYYLFLKSPVQSHQVLSDAVDDLIELVLQKKGRVVITEDSTLDQEKKVGLITRY